MSRYPLPVMNSMGCCFKCCCTSFLHKMQEQLVRSKIGLLGYPSLWPSEWAWSLPASTVVGSCQQTSRDWRYAEKEWQCRTFLQHPVRYLIDWRVGWTGFCFPYCSLYFFPLCLLTLEGLFGVRGRWDPLWLGESVLLWWTHFTERGLCVLIWAG